MSEAVLAPAPVTPERPRRVIICIVGGWSGGSKLVKDSYGEAKEKKADMSEQRQEKKDPKRQVREDEGRRGLLSVFRRKADDASPKG